MLSATSRYSPLDAATETFRVLAQPPQHLALTGFDLGEGFPCTRLPVAELAEALQDPSLGCERRDAAWRAVARKARAGEPAWVVAAAGVAGERLRRICDRLVAGHVGDRIDIEAAVLSGFVQALRGINVEHPHVEARLLWAAHRAGSWRIYAEWPCGADAPPHRLKVHLGSVLPDPVWMDLFF